MYIGVLKGHKQTYPSPQVFGNQGNKQASWGQQRPSDWDELHLQQTELTHKPGQG